MQGESLVPQRLSFSSLSVLELGKRCRDSHFGTADAGIVVLNAPIPLPLIVPGCTRVRVQPAKGAWWIGFQVDWLLAYQSRYNDGPPHLLGHAG